MFRLAHLIHIFFWSRFNTPTILCLLHSNKTAMSKKKEQSRGAKLHFNDNDSTQSIILNSTRNKRGSWQLKLRQKSIKIKCMIFLRAGRLKIFWKIIQCPQNLLLLRLGISILLSVEKRCFTRSIFWHEREDLALSGKLQLCIVSCNITTTASFSWLSCTDGIAKAYWGWLSVQCVRKYISVHDFNTSNSWIWTADWNEVSLDDTRDYAVLRQWRETPEKFRP